MQDTIFKRFYMIYLTFGQIDPSRTSLSVTELDASVQNARNVEN